MAPPPDEASGSRARSGSGSNPSQPQGAPVRPRPPTVSMVSRGALGGAIGSAGGPGMTRAQQPRMTFRPVLPQRRKPTEIKQEPTTPASLGEGSSASSPAGRGGARGGRGGGRGRGRGREITMTASGPFAMGTGSLSRSERARRGGGMGGGGGGGGFAPGSSSAADSKSDMKPLRSDASYRNPDKLRDAEQYSDQEDDVEIVDMGNVAELDELAPRSLPRMQEKDKKKGKAVVKKEKGKGKEGVGIVKPDPEDEEASDRARLQGSESGSGSASSTPPVIGGVVKKPKKTKKEEAGMPGAPSDDEEDDDAGAEEVVRGADALDLSESEEEEMMDDLADDFVFDDAHSDGGTGDNNRLYLFQFPQMFPKFKAAKAKPMPAAKAESDAEASSSTVQASSSGPPASALSSSPPGGSKDKPKRSVAFAEGVKNGTATPPDTSRDRKPTPAELSAGMKRSAMDGSSHLTDPLSNSSSQSGPEGMIGRLQIYKDGRVEMHFGSPSNPLIMEVAGGSQSSFLQDVALLDAKEKRATVLGEVHRKFTVSPGVEGMLRDWEGWCAGEGAGGGESSDSSEDEVEVKREVKREASARA